MSQKGIVSGPLYMCLLETLTANMPPFLVRGNQHVCPHISFNSTFINKDRLPFCFQIILSAEGVNKPKKSINYFLFALLNVIVFVTLTKSFVRNVHFLNTFRPVTVSNNFFYTFRPVAESYKTCLYVSANNFLAETYHIPFGAHRPLIGAARTGPLVNAFAYSKTPPG